MDTGEGREARLEARHRPSGENSCFMGGELTFSEYVLQTTAMLRRVHTRLGTVELEKAVAGNAPFELYPAANGHGKPCRRGVLLTHGLTDSPYFIRYLAEFFQANGFVVKAVLLPGHGTQPGDLLNVSWQDWVKTVAYGADRLAEEVDEMYLAGLSAGGMLSVYQCLFDKRVRGLLLFSPAFKISSRAAWAKLHRLYSWMWHKAAWVNIMPDRDIYKYESLCKNAAAQMYALTGKLNALLQKRDIFIPVFAAASQDDTTVITTATLEFMAHAHHPASRLVLYTTDTSKLPAGIPVEKLEMVNSVVMEQRILSSAHTAIVLPPEDSHYGVKGDYSNALHYYPGDMAKYHACSNQQQEVLLGEITAANLKAGILRRLMYNPDFEKLKISLKRFMDQLPGA